MMTINEAIDYQREMARLNRSEYESDCIFYGKEVVDRGKKPKCLKRAEKHEQLAEWLEELKELRAYKERMEMQYLDDIDNPLEPLKLCHALKIELLKYDYRKEHKPEAITVIDYTIMYALKHCLEEQLRILKAKNEI